MEVFPGHEVSLTAGMDIVTVAGARGSSTSMSGVAPVGDIEPGERFHLLAVGGIAGRCLAVPSDGEAPTSLA